MSLQKFMIVNAVPFGLARLQSGTSKTVINITGGVESIDNNYFSVLNRLKKTNKKIAHIPSQRMLKKRNKLFHNHSSPEKLKLQRGLLEQQLKDVNVEKMRLFLENEDLKLRCSSLEEENNFLRLQLQSSPDCRQDQVNRLCEDSLKHAEGLGSSASVQHPDDGSWRTVEQFSTEAVDSIPTNRHLPLIETLDEICCIPTWANDTDVFVVPLSQDITNQPTSTDLNAIARTICHEEEISCDDKNGFVEEFEIGQMDDISFPELWTFDNLYEDPDDEVDFYF